MTEETNKLPPDWAIEEATSRSKVNGWTLKDVKHYKSNTSITLLIITLAEMIHKHEKPPVDPDLLIARKIGHDLNVKRGLMAYAKACLDGHMDNTSYIRGIHEGFKQGRSMCEQSPE